MLVRGGRLIDPASGIDGLYDVRVEKIVLEIGEHLEPAPGERVLDVPGAVVAPGFIDMHVHLREPGNPEKETIASGTEAAVRGGFTAVACMANTSPALDEPDLVRDVASARAHGARCRVYPIAALTKGRKGRETSDYDALARAGAVAFSDDGDWVASREVLERACERAARLEAAFISHCEPEEEAVERDLGVARAFGRAWHLAHLSTKRAVELVRDARADGVRVSAEATPHHLLCTAETARAMGEASSVNPPLRCEDDVRALRDAVRDGTIEVLASDHAPHTREQKEKGAPGFTGLEVAVGAYATALPGLPLRQFVALLSTNPARVLHVEGGTLQRGAPADVTIFRDEPWRVEAARFASKGKVTPFEGMTLDRRVVATIVEGELAYRA